MPPDYRKNRYSFTKRLILSSREFDREKPRFTLKVQVWVTCRVAGDWPDEIVTRTQDVLAIFRPAADF